MNHTVSQSPGPRYVVAVASHLVTRLHRSGEGGRCTCGPCRHLILVSARRAGIDPERLALALPPEPEPETEQRRRRRVREVPVVSTMTVVRGDRRHEGPAAVLELLRP